MVGWGQGVFKISQHTSKAHNYRAVPGTRAPDTQLTVAVVAPALEGAASHNRARVRIPQSNGGSRVAWKDVEHRGKRSHISDSMPVRHRTDTKG